jgi:2-iminobutanoate/2-iminopropanoate deaminase
MGPFDVKGVLTNVELLVDFAHMTHGEREEMKMLGIISAEGVLLQSERPPQFPKQEPEITKRLITAPEVLNEAFHYPKPSSFARGLRVDVGGVTVLLISGTASVDENGLSVHIGDFGAQCWRTYRNITALLNSEGASWHDIVKTTCYLRDIERDYDQFNRIRTSFFRWLALDPLPASVGVQTRLCREDLLIEIEAIALFNTR